MSIVRSADCPLQPWKNGRGRTREIAVYPPASTIDDFLWRASVAHVDSAAPFSRFSGIDRQIVLLDGAGFVMTLDGAHRHALSTPFAPFAFPGEADVDIELIDGPTRDFNLMLRRGYARGRIDIWHAAGLHTLPPDAALLFVARGSTTCGEHQLASGDAWLPDPGVRSHASVALAASTVALVVAIDLSSAPAIRGGMTYKDGYDQA